MWTIRSILKRKAKNYRSNKKWEEGQRIRDLIRNERNDISSEITTSEENGEISSVEATELTRA